MICVLAAVAGFIVGLVAATVCMIAYLIHEDVIVPPHHNEVIGPIRPRP